MARIYIAELGTHVGEEIPISGWLYHKRSSGKVRFLVLRDGTGLLQCVMVKGMVAEEVFNQFEV